MKYAVIFSLFFIAVASTSNAQFTVRLIVTDVATRKYDDIYVSGNFNNWNPKDENFKLKPFAGNRKSIVIKDIAAGTYAFKFTRGSQDKQETTADGRDISDRILEVNGDLSLEYSIPGWKDDYPETPKRYTASPQVRLFDSAFTIPQLNRKRRIWIYLPKGYASTSKIYPVLYMQDGQNLFNEKTAKTAEWGIDECLDTLQKKIEKDCIVIGIENAGYQQVTEYNPYDDLKDGKGEGKQYAEFIAKTLKPYVDSKYRTKKGPESTFIAGGGAGALISLYTLMQYPDIFGGAGVFSPIFNASPFIFSDAAKFTAKSQPKIYLYAGGKEPNSTPGDIQKMADILQKKPSYIIRKIVNPLGQANETCWRQEFAAFYSWLMN